MLHSISVPLDCLGSFNGKSLSEGTEKIQRETDDGTEKTGASFTAVMKSAESLFGINEVSP